MNTKKHLVLAISLAMGLGLTACQTIEQKPVKSTNATLQLSSERMVDHLKAFENIAKQNNGNRAVGTKGGQASGEYIYNFAKKAGFAVQEIPFENREKTVGQNIIVEIPGESNDSAILVGAHYDSVKMGPGINDNASGVALILDLIQQYSTQKTKPKNTIYLAFWDSEEEGIGGSQDFVSKLTTEQLKGLKAYINVDMVGTKAPEILIADADKSSVGEMEKMLKEQGMAESDYKPLLDGLRGLPSHAGDLALENTLKDFFKKKNLKIKEDVSTLTASDTLPFLGKVPVTSIILFNEKVNDKDELEFAPCYHQACDTLEQIDPKSLQIAGEAVVHLLNSLDK
jgi:aminopeptidase S